MTALIVVAVFGVAVALDFAAARYNLALHDRRIEIGARWSVVMCVLSSVALYAFIEISPWMLLPECLGMYLGTIAGALRQHRTLPEGLAEV